MGDDQRRALKPIQPALQPFEHFDVEMIGRFVEQEQMGFFKQNTCQHETRLLPTAQVSNRCVHGDVLETKGTED
ncbi:MAG TPA: hypothetical protein VLL94_07005, partial [Nitrospiraceae bacterium]|nr:hypothetical protein [Nitrospiraceae bacterium]